MAIRAIDSYARQTHKDKELIFIDDASERDYSGVEVKVSSVGGTYIKLEKNDILKAYNIGVEIADSDIVTFLHDDDEFNGNDSLSCRVNAFDSGVVCVWSDAIIIRNGQASMAKGDFPNKEKIWMQDYIHFDTMMWDKCIHKDIQFEGGYEGDYAFKLQMVLKYFDSLRYVPKATILAHAGHSRDTERNTPINSAKEQLAIREKYKWLR